MAIPYRRPKHPPGHMFSRPLPQAARGWGLGLEPTTSRRRCNGDCLIIAYLSLFARCRTFSIGGLTMSEHQIVVTELDKYHLAPIRPSIADFIHNVAGRILRPGLRPILDIAPQDHAGASPHFPPEAHVETRDINPAAGCAGTGDTCRLNFHISSSRCNPIVRTEVLEHNLQPFDAVRELRRTSRTDGVQALTLRKGEVPKHLSMPPADRSPERRSPNEAPGAQLPATSQTTPLPARYRRPRMPPRSDN